MIVVVKRLEIFVVLASANSAKCTKPKNTKMTTPIVVSVPRLSMFTGDRNALAMRLTLYFTVGSSALILKKDFNTLARARVDCLPSALDDPIGGRAAAAAPPPPDSNNENMLPPKPPNVIESVVHPHTRNKRTNSTTNSLTPCNMSEAKSAANHVYLHRKPLPFIENTVICMYSSTSDPN